MFFCGGPAQYDKVIIYDPNNIEKIDVIMYIYKLVNKNTIQLFHYEDIENRLKNNNPCYTLMRKI